MARLARIEPVRTTLRRQRISRLSKADRKAMIEERAIPMLADRGFAISTRDIAAALGISQGLIHKHFGSKDALITAVLERAFGKRDVGGRRDRSAVLRDLSQPLAARLSVYYAAAGGDDGSRLRLFVRAALEGSPLPARRGTELTHDVFGPVIDALRAEAGLPPIAEKAMMRGEREAAMMLHASIVFLGIRKHVYRMPMPADRQAIVDLYARIYVPGAVATIRQIHAGELGDNFTVEQLKRAGSR